MNLPDAIKQAGEAVKAINDAVSDAETAYSEVPADVWTKLKDAAGDCSDALEHIEKAIADL